MLELLLFILYALFWGVVGIGSLIATVYLLVAGFVWFFMVSIVLLVIGVLIVAAEVFKKR